MQLSLACCNRGLRLASGYVQWNHISRALMMTTSTMPSEDQLPAEILEGVLS